ncbi:hypothetical protein C1Y63_04885 [Corynebacterium sp. 13CS0277]|uniref:hypothetical protein n=1 Tax=Corynebacterium sp. 13CS0277 TaxID=2071994 RepID=UPI000D03153B|nr:hypothetical protein [Corynebacterium sp. 13CS0277]PRQ11747.1 hypothetical protein C1Y63_04885 [Corynebacterium sp. 13CS0277]
MNHTHTWQIRTPVAGRDGHTQTLAARRDGDRITLTVTDWRGVRVGLCLTPTDLDAVATILADAAAH